ncbi:hypothetical protein MO867_09985 [Microbulbifer sp. OS29]|uniref:Uncharacterized protein n=1 Tax=Microbulbifer okhotskensis TaxID=2926617 RepID=A0A9X2ELY4_9GAMM|nr:hypothetical protein [Microbulbifer okhotskensis]MCO1334669.1 hypothetical protein [Microbulbifer okhotskensis]
MEAGLVYVILLDRKGSGRKLDLQAMKSWQPDRGILWLYFGDFNNDTTE